MTKTIITPQVAWELALEDLGLSHLTIKEASRGRTSAYKRSRIQVNESTGKMRGATVAPINPSLKGMGKYVDNRHDIVYHPHYNGVTVHHKKDIVINWDYPPTRTGRRDRSNKLWHWSLNSFTAMGADQCPLRKFMAGTT